MTVAEVKVYNSQGEEVGQMHLDEALFGAPLRSAVISDVARALMANRRQGTASAKGRDEVSGSGAKLWRQKGTGHARMGSRRSPIWRHGGVVFGPKPRDYRCRLPKKVRQVALQSLISDKVRSGAMIVLETLNCAEPHTKTMVQLLDALPGCDGKVLLVLPKPDRNVLLSGRNIPRLKMVLADTVTVLDLLDAERVIVPREAMETLESRLS